MTILQLSIIHSFTTKYLWFYFWDPSVYSCSSYTFRFSIRETPSACVSLGTMGTSDLFPSGSEVKDYTNFLVCEWIRKTAHTYVSSTVATGNYCCLICRVCSFFLCFFGVFLLLLASLCETLCETSSLRQKNKINSKLKWKQTLNIHL